jgi:hypothetical protein
MNEQRFNEIKHLKNKKNSEWTDSYQKTT